MTCRNAVRLRTVPHAVNRAEPEVCREQVPLPALQRDPRMRGRCKSR